MADRLAQTFLNEIADIERERAVGDFYDTDKDLELFVQAVLSYAATALNLRALESKAQAAEAIDLAALRAGVDAIDRDEVRKARLTLPGNQEPLVGENDLERAREMLRVVEAAAENQHPAETGLRLELGLSFPFFRVQLVVADQPSVLAPLERQVRSKLASFGEEDIRRLWAMLGSEFRPQEGEMDSPPISPDKGVLGPSFFDPVTLDDIRDRIAKYAAVLKPFLVRKSLESGRPSFRSILLQVPQLLAAQNVQPLTLHEQRILECLLRIYRTWGDDHKEEFQAALGLNAHHWMQRAASLDGTLLRHKKAPTLEAKDKLLLINLRRLLNYTDGVVAFESSVERALLQYKLGLEVMLPQTRDEVSERIEIDLQKSLCRFLVERDIRAFGKSFGRTEIDLLAEMSGERFLIETKILQTARSKSIERYVTQLVSYMDHEEPATRGVLIIYNLSDAILISERKWFRQRLWVLPINLCEFPPSKIRKRMLIEDGGNAAMLRYVPSWNERVERSRADKPVRRSRVKKR